MVLIYSMQFQASDILVHIPLTRKGGIETNVSEAITTRRARRVIDENRECSDDILDAFIDAIRLAPSCFNNQPWRVVFVHDKEMLANIKTALSKGNEWATKSTLILAISAKKEDDCVIGDREYFLFDCGLGIGQLVLKATEMGLIAHPIAGFSPKKVREVLGVPDDHTVITLVICGYPGTDDTLLSDKQKEAEMERPGRKSIGENFFLDRWDNPLR